MVLGWALQPRSEIKCGLSEAAKDQVSRGAFWKVLPQAQLKTSGSQQLEENSRALGRT